MCYFRLGDRPLIPFPHLIVRVFGDPCLMNCHRSSTYFYLPFSRRLIKWLIIGLALTTCTMKNAAYYKYILQK